MQYKVIAPLVINISKNKKYSINLNTYRNAHYQVNNKAKIIYAETLKDQIIKLPKFNKINIEYVVYAKTHRRFDVMNVGSVQSKFFDDALVLNGKLEDDNYNYIPNESVSFGGVDKSSPRVEILINEI